MAEAAPNENANDKAKKQQNLTDEQCLDTINKEMTKKMNKFDKKHVQDLAKNYGQFKNVVQDQQYSYESMVFNWNVDQDLCGADLETVELYFTDDSQKKQNKSLQEEKLRVEIDAKNYRPLKAEMKTNPRAMHTDKDLDNWAGYTIWEGTSESNSYIPRAYTYFDVPIANDPSGTAENCDTGFDMCWLSIWGGLTIHQNSDTLLVQSGTDSTCETTDCGTANQNYYAWLELILPSADIDERNTCTNVTVSPRDRVISSVYHEEVAGDDKYTYFVYNEDNGLACSSIATISSTSSWAPQYAQYIVERTALSDGQTISISRLAEFDPIEMTGIYLNENGNYYYISDLFDEGTFYEVTMENGGIDNITVGSVCSVGKFTATWQSSAGTQ